MQGVSEHIRRNVYGIVAIFIALGGTAVAAQSLPKNSVVSKTIKNRQVKTVDLRPGAVKGPQVADGSLTGADVDEASFDQAVLQRRVDGTCAADSAISSIAADGTVSCDPDNGGSSYDAAPGGGLRLDSQSRFGLIDSCADGQVLKSTTGSWACADDTDTDTNSGGDITGVTAGTGLTGGGTAGAVTLAIADAFKLPQGCSNGHVAKWTGTVWVCAADNDTQDSASQILTKLKTVDGPGSGLNADQLDGFEASQLQPGCQAGYIRIADLCIESGDECCFTYATGANRCRAVGGHLPTYADLLAAKQSGVAFGTPQFQLDWTSDVTADNAAIFINSETPPDMDGERPMTTSSFVRCAHTPRPSAGYAP